MANSCSNYIVFSNLDKDKRSKIVSIFEGLRTIKDTYAEIPFYEELMQQEISDESSLTHKFGTKWIDVNDISDDVDDVDDVILTIDCETAWSPCLGLSEMIAKLFDITVSHDYSECGCDFGGRCIITKDSYDDDCLSYLGFLEKYDSEGFQNELEYLLDNLYEGNKEEMLANDEYSKYADDIKNIEQE